MSHVLSALVGLVFLGAGTLKALDSARFVAHVRRYRLLPPDGVWPSVLTFITIECALGAALMVNMSALLLPLAALVIVGFIVLTAWGVRSGRVEDCGCYGGLVLLTPVQSMALDGLYLALVLGAWWLAPAAQPLGGWKVAAVAGAGAAAWAAATRSRREPLADLRLLRTGRGWRPNWLTGYARDVTRGAHFVVFLSRECPYCKRWVPLLNVIEVDPDLPSVVAVMSLEGGELQAFLDEHLIKFPVAHMPQGLVSLMTSAFPTAALVEDGRITGKWVGEMPREYVSRAREFFTTVAVPAAPAGGTFAG